MNNIKKFITTQAFVLVATMLLGSASAYASEVTGTLSSSSSNSQIGGTVGGSSVSGTLSGGSSSISGTVGGGSGGGGSGGTSALVGSVSGGGSGNVSGPLVLGASTVADTPGLPNTGVDPGSPKTISWNFIVYFLGLLVTFATYVFFRRKNIINT